MPIVGLGASAGGLEAFAEFFSAMPAPNGLAFIVVAHLAPDHASLLPQLIGKKTEMPVIQAQDGMPVKPDHVYVIPPNKEMTIFNAILHLLELSKPRGKNLPIDTFLRSLALDQGPNAIGIILSGTGTDGALGLRAIKGENGMLMAQAPDSAKYDGMPRSAIATGLVDFVLPPARMPEQLLNYVNHQQRKRDLKFLAGTPDIENEFRKIFAILRNAGKHDFSLYKRNTITRRIERRMHVHQIDTLADYVLFLHKSERECAILFKELLIGVTSFFRDPAAFDNLQKKYLPALLKDKPDDYVVRIWAPGCSTGEEAYSVAMILTECMEEANSYLNVQIFATDLDEDAIKTARAGQYPESIEADVSQERLRRFFTKKGNQYKIKKNIREMVVFAPQNLIKDPPFTKLDLLCCRNLLIYFSSELQRRLLPIFHYSLKKDGILFLGSSETVGHATDLFARLDDKWKIFRRYPTTQAPQPVLEFQPPLPPGEKSAEESLLPAPRNGAVSTLNLLRTILSHSDIPAFVVIDHAANITYIHGRTGRFLEPAQGEANNNLLKMARPGLRTSLTSALRSMLGNRREITIKGLRTRDDGDTEINLTIRPLPDFQTGRQDMMVIFFEEIFPVREKKPQKTNARTEIRKSSDEAKQLEEELLFTRNNLQTSIEALETANEELKSSNEELQSTNEELQSTNEELETSREELQSLNEESITVNTELQDRIDELVEANDDIKNLLEATEIATIFLDINYNIRRFTSKATEIFPLAATDTGRPISHFASNLKDVDLRQYAEKVLKDLGKQEVEIFATDGKIYRMRLRPYRTSGNMIDGIVITFDDITALRRLLDQARRLAAVVRDSNDAITMQDGQGRIIAWNHGAERLYGYSEAEALEMNITKLIPPKRLAELASLTATLRDGKANSLVTERLAKNGAIIKVWLTTTRLLDDHGRPEFIATTERDVNELDQAALKELRRGTDAQGQE
jgi:two-component system CheB/CheR fusion protein